MSTSDHTTPMKRCAKGDACVHPDGCWQPATSGYFNTRRQCKDGFAPYCKFCTAALAKAWREANPDKAREKNTKNYRSHIEKRREYQREYHYADSDARLEYMREYRLTNADMLREKRREYRQINYEVVTERSRKYGRVYYQANRGKMSEKGREYREANPEKERERHRKYNEANPEKRRERGRSWRKTNPDKALAIKQRHRAIKRGLPNIFTAADWQRALDYFNGCCAVCGRQLRDLFGTHTAAADHWIPLTDTHSNNPGTVPTNIIPLCHGVGGCNNRKFNRDPLEFLETEFGKRRAKQILARIEAYFEWVKHQGGA